MNRLVLLLAAFFLISPAYADDTSAPAFDAVDYLDQCRDDSDADDYQSVIDDCSEALKQGGLQPDEMLMAYLYRGMAHHSRDEGDAAIADFTEALSENPQHKDVDFIHFERGSVYLDEKQYDKALADFDEAIHLTPTEATFYTMRGDTYFGMRRNAEAIKDLSKAIELKPTDDGALDERSIVYLMQGDYAAAVADLTQVLQLKPDDESARTVMGEAYYFAGQYPKAVEALDAALVKFPDDDYAMIWRYLASQRAGVDRRKELAAQLDAMKDPGWTHTLGELYLGKATRDQVLADTAAAVTDPVVQKQALCQAKSMLAEFYRNDSQRSVALGLFKEAAGLCAPDTIGSLLVQQGLAAAPSKKAGK